MDYLTSEQRDELRAALERELRKLERACGGEIGYERLLVFPESPTCAACSRDGDRG